MSPEKESRPDRPVIDIVGPILAQLTRQQHAFVDKKVVEMKAYLRSHALRRRRSPDSLEAPGAGAGLTRLLKVWKLCEKANYEEGRYQEIVAALDD